MPRVDESLTEGVGDVKKGSRKCPYTLDPEVLDRYPQARTVFGRRYTDPEASFYQQFTDSRAVIRAAHGEPGYTHVEYAMARGGWTVAEHFHGAYGEAPLGRESPAVQALGRFPVED